MTDYQTSSEEVTNTTFTAEPDGLTVEITRTFDAPRDRVFETYTNPELVPDWWGSRHYSTTVDEMDVRQGGRWRFCIHDDGNVDAFHGIYHEVAPPERIVQTFEYEGTPGIVQLETATFDEQDGGTRLTVQSVAQSAENRDMMIESGMEDGSRETWGRFADLLRAIEGEAST